MDSQVILNTMEVLETKPLNELVMEATVKVCYVSETPNRNNTVINKEIGREIAATLPGAPVVGLFNEETQDFEQHSRKMTIKNGEVRWEELTRPYGFVSPLHQPWYQDFVEDGETRTYLMCKVFLWTRQYTEAEKVLGKGQSMELSEKTMSGYYEGDVFIFTQATLDKLCILGDDYAPCFEGAKFFSLHEPGYAALVDEIEKAIGERYYVLNDKLVEKSIDLEYALSLGWPLKDLVQRQLDPSFCGLSVVDIFAEEQTIFAIVRTDEDNKYYKIHIIIKSDDSVVLADTVTPVTMEWVPIVGDTEIPITAIKMNDNNNPAASAPVAEPVFVATGSIAELVGEPVAEPVAEPTTEPVAEPAAEPTNEPVFVSTEPTAEPTAEPTVEPTTEPIAEPAAAEPVAEPSEFEAKFTELQNAFTALQNEMTALKEETSNKDARITSLEGELNAYKQKAAAQETKDKEEMIASYKAILSEDEIAPIAEKIAEFSLDQLESKLSVAFARKQISGAVAQNSQFQVNVQTVGTNTDADLPYFMKQAEEYDNTHGLNY